jgi:hypothetical protein
MYNGVVVKFSYRADFSYLIFSLKTKTTCYWCRGRFWKSEEEVREFVENLHPKVLDTNEFPLGLGMNNEIEKMLNNE